MSSTEIMLNNLKQHFLVNSYRKLAKKINIFKRFNYKNAFFNHIKKSIEKQTTNKMQYLFFFKNFKNFKKI